MDSVTQTLTNRTSRHNERDKYLRCPISDLDLTNCERCSPSYVRLPADYPKLTFTARYALFPSTGLILIVVSLPRCTSRRHGLAACR